MLFDKASMPGMKKETTSRYVELEIKQEPVVKETVTPNHPDNVTGDIPVDEQLDEESTAFNPIVSKSVLHETSKSLTGMATTLLWLQLSSKIPPQYLKPDQLLTKSSGKRP